MSLYYNLLKFMAPALLLSLSCTHNVEDPCKTDNQGYTKLMRYAEQDDAEQALAQLAKGADSFQIHETTGGTALSIACGRGFVRTTTELLPYYRRAPTNIQATALLSAGFHGYTNVLGILLTSGFDPNAKLPEGMTVLHRIAPCARLDVVKIMVAHGAQLDADDHGIDSLLARASIHGNVVLVDYLVSNGCWLNTNTIAAVAGEIGRGYTTDGKWAGRKTIVRFVDAGTSNRVMQSLEGKVALGTLLLEQEARDSSLDVRDF